eukprot:569071_1
MAKGEIQTDVFGGRILNPMNQLRMREIISLHIIHCCVFCCIYRWIKGQTVQPAAMKKRTYISDFGSVFEQNNAFKSVKRTIMQTMDIDEHVLMKQYQIMVLENTESME